MYSWLWLNDETPSYALDIASQAVTPSLPLVTQAPQRELHRIGAEPEALTSAARASVCHSVR
jgi:hypothetical protein